MANFLATERLIKEAVHPVANIPKIQDLGRGGTLFSTLVKHAVYKCTEVF